MSYKSNPQVSGLKKLAAGAAMKFFTRLTQAG